MLQRNFLEEPLPLLGAGAARVVLPEKALESEGLDQCGLTTLAGRTVGAPFVGAAASAVVVAELLRMVLGDRRYEAVDGTLRSLNEPYAIPKVADEPFNPGSVSACL